MSKAIVELDFLSTGNRKAPKPATMERKKPFRGIQSAISRINPELLRRVIASGTAAKGGPEARSPPGDSPFRHAATPLPALTSASRSGSVETAPLTIFYNGTVVAFDLPQDKAESVLKLAEKGINVGGGVGSSDPGHAEDLLAKLDAGVRLWPETGTVASGCPTAELLPIPRRKSLERFFAKRKERLTVSQLNKGAECEANLGLVRETETITAAQLAIMRTSSALS